MTSLPSLYHLFVSCAQYEYIGHYQFNTATKKLTRHTPLAASDFAMPMAFIKEHRYLVVATRGKQSYLLVYQLPSSAEHDDIKLIAQTPVAEGFVYIDYHAPSGLLIGASYGGHCVCTYRLNDIVSPPSGTQAQTALPALQTIHDIRRAHAIVISQDGRHIYVSALGSNTIYCFTADQQKLIFTAKTQTEDQFGPRHMCFNEDDSCLYVLSEFKSVIACFKRNKNTGELQFDHQSARSPALSYLSTGKERPTYTEAIHPDPQETAHWLWGADLHYSAAHHVLISSERTSSQLIIHKVNHHQIQVISAQTTETQPRGFALSPCGHYVFVCGEKSPYLSVCQMNKDHHQLTECDRILLFPALSQNASLSANWITVIPAT